ncbi:Protein-L-isoaspartate O-methyltransferase [gamma proteobacterium HdN1]|nr:Protein-L-isoaspartate O-methyltransferase [gamma proteobacterium HdN1]
MTSLRTRRRMVKRLREAGISQPEVLAVMEKTPRHLFVDEAFAHRAYEDTALPIGFNQTISQPYIVARMTGLLLQAGPLSDVLEIGTGSGYQTAILAQLVKHVYSLERIKALQDRARQRLHSLRIRNVSLRHSDGGLGWAEQAPYDGILAAAAPAEIPEDLILQLRPGGRMVIPVGGASQQLVLVIRKERGFERQVVEDVNFVPFQSGIA